MSDINVQTFQGKVNISNNLKVGSGHLFVDTLNNQVGLNTNTPLANLHVNGNTYVNTDLRVGSKLLIDSGASDSNVLVVTGGNIKADYLHGDGSNIQNITSSQWTTVNTNELYYDVGNVGIGNQNPSTTLDVTGTSSFSDDLTVGTDKLFVDVSAGRVGVGTVAPGYTLDIAGDINFTGNLTKNGSAYGGSGGSGGGVWQAGTGTKIYYSAGNVGVANTDPDHTLSVGSNLYVDDAGSNVLVVDGNVAANQITLGQFEIVPSYGLDDVVNESNTTTNTVHLSNVTTGVITTSNALIGGELTVTGNMVTSSNITVTGNVVVDDNLYLTSNAKLLVNSNTVVEHAGPHGRGVAALKKFPEIAFDASKLDGNPTTNTFVQAGYTVSASSQLTGSSYEPWHAFDNTLSGNEGWITDSPRYNSSSPGEAQSGLGAIQFPAASGRYGEYIDLQLPSKIRVKHFIIKTRSAVASWEPEASPGAGYLYGSINGTDWTEIKAFSGLTYGGMGTDGGTQETVQVDSTTPYNYLRFQVTHRAGQNGTDQYAAVGEIEYYGYEEDPPAGDTSVDTTFTSIMNTPQTTGVNVYVDGNLGETFTNRVTGPTPVGTGTSYDSTGKYWELTGELTSNVTLEANTFLEGDQPHAVSVWFNSSNLEANVSNTCVFSISDQEKLNSQNLDLQSNTWHNLTYAYQGEGGSRVTYLDGRKVSEDQAEDTFGEYPPFAMTGYSQGGYVVSASSHHPNYLPWYAFDDQTAHATNDNSWISSTDINYDETTGVATSLADLTTVDGVQKRGEWIQMEFPNKMRLSYIALAAQTDTEQYRAPKEGVIVGSNDGTTWETLHAFANQTSWTDNVFNNYVVNTNVGKGYRYVRIIVEKVQYDGTQNSNRRYTSLGEIKFYGHRENDLVRLPDPTNVLKYPHIAMTGPAQRGYVASASDEYYDGNYPAWDAFDSDSETGWIGYNGAWSGGAYQGGVGSVPLRNLGSDNGGTAITENGEWLIIQMPHKVLVYKVRLHERQGNTHNAPKNGRFYGSNDGTNWTALHSGFTNVTYDNTKGVYSEINVNASIAYNRIALVVTAIVSNPWVGVGDMQIYGTEENSSVPIQIGGGNIDKVANFRVYDKFIGEDQALEIWDAQKDVFREVKNSMTLQKGRLGIGTTEPEGRLAVADEPSGLEEFPPRAMTGYKTYFEGHGEFCASASTEYSGNLAYEAFDKITSSGATHWSQDDPAHYDNTTGVYTGPSDYFTNVEGQVVLGHWLQIEFPYKIKYSYSIIQAPYHSTGRQPHTGYIVGSNDLSGIWTSLHNYSGMTRTGVRDFVTYTPPTVSEQTFKYIRLVIEKLGGGETHAGVDQWNIFGTREQGQSVLHDGQLTLTKSLTVPRIGPAIDADDTPRRDRLVVEYNTSTNPTFEGAVRDTSGRGNDGVFVGTASYDATEKALTFPGTVTNNIYTGNLGPNIKGNQPLTISLWFKTSDDRDQALFSILPGDSDEDTNKVFQVRTEGDSADYNLSFIYWSSDYRYNVPALDNPQGKWFHLVAMNVGGTKTAGGTTYDRGDPSNRRLFLNGVELFTPSSTTYSSAVTGNASAILNLDPNSRLIIGSRFRDSGQYPLNGSISNFKLYDCTLTAEEVKTLYDMGRTGSVANPQPLHIAAPLYAPGTTVQLVHKHAHDYHTVNSNYGRITPMTLSIKPKFSNSKILVQMMVNGEGHHDSTFRVLRYTDGTFTAHMPPDAHQTPADSDGIAPVTYDVNLDSTMGSVHIAFVDSPNTTGVVEYQLYYKVQNSTTVYRFSLNQTHRDSTGTYPADEHSVSSIVLQEIAQ